MIVDLFAGPGGWDLAAHEIGIEPLGIEFDDAACKTREAAGLKTLQADVSELDPADFDVDGLIASPPCQAFSMAGKGEGRNAIHAYVKAIKLMGDGKPVSREGLERACGDDRAHMVLEPLRWILAANPEWVALEQVKPVQPIWDAMKPVLEKLGYSVWTGVLSAECYGVPQTRERAFLIASRTRKVSMPPPTHQRYIAPKIKTHDKQEESLFDGGERTRVVHPSDRGLLPWISMAEALGWQDGPSPSPSPSVTGGGGTTGGVEVFASKGARERVCMAVKTRGASDRGSDEFDPAAQPSRTITGKSDSWEPVAYRASAQDNAEIREQSEPAPTIAFGHDAASAGWIPTEVRSTQSDASTANSKSFDPTERPCRVVTTQVGSWELRAGTNENDVSRKADEPAATLRFGERGNAVDWIPTHMERRQTGGDGSPVNPRPVDEPAPTIMPSGVGKGRERWIESRPSTTVAGDQRIFPPARTDRNPDYQTGDGPVSQANGGNAVRVTQREAAILQSFPANYPWQGSKTKQFQQIGNAVPPLLALAVLSEVANVQPSEEAA